MILTPHTSQPPAGTAPSDLARDLRVGALLLPTPGGEGWADSVGGLRVTGGTGSLITRAGRDGYERASTSGAAWADYLQDKGANDPRDGYAWVMRATLVSSLANWGGLISRTTDNGTTSGWSWQRTNGDVVAAYHGVAGNWPLGITFSTLLDGQPHTLVGVWRKDQSRLELWRDGILLAAVNGVSTAPGYSAGQGQIKIMSSRDVAALNGSVAMVAVLGVAPSPAEASELSANPWLLFAPPSAEMVFGVETGPGIKELSGSAGLRLGMSGSLVVPGVKELGGSIGIKIGASGNLTPNTVFAEEIFNGDGNLPNPPWTKTALNGVANLTLLGGKLRGITAGNSALYAHNNTPPSADYAVSLEIQCGATSNLNGSAVGVVGRYLGTQYYAARYVGSTGEYVLEKFDLFGGGLISLGAYAAGLAASATLTLSLRMIADQIAVLVDGVAVIEATDSTISGAGQAGVLAYTTSSTAWYGDNFRAVALAADTWLPWVFDGSDWVLPRAAWRHNGATFERIDAAPTVIA